MNVTGLGMWHRMLRRHQVGSSNPSLTGTVHAHPQRRQTFYTHIFTMLSVSPEGTARARHLFGADKPAPVSLNASLNTCKVLLMPLTLCIHWTKTKKSVLWFLRLIPKGQCESFFNCNLQTNMNEGNTAGLSLFCRGCSVWTWNQLFSSNVLILRSLQGTLQLTHNK